MSNNFAPKIDAEVAFERPQEAVVDRTGEAMVKGLSSLFAPRTGRTGSAGGGSDYNAQLQAEYLRGVKINEQLKAQGQHQKAALNMQTLNTNFIAAGGDLNDASLRAAVVGMTGKEIAAYSQSPEDMRNAALDSNENMPILLTKYQRQGMTQDEALEAARNEVADQELNTHVLETASTRDSAYWEKHGQTAFDNNNAYITDQFSTIVVETTTKGGVLSQQEVQQLKVALEAEHAQQLAGLPSNLSEAQMKHIKEVHKSQMNILDGLDTVSQNDAVYQYVQGRLKNRPEGVSAEQELQVILTELGAEGTAIAALAQNGNIDVKAFLEAGIEAGGEIKKIEISEELLFNLADPNNNAIDGFEGVDGSNQSVFANVEYTPPTRESVVSDAVAMGSRGQTIPLAALQDRTAAKKFGDSVFATTVAIDNMGKNGEVLTPSKLEAIIGNPQEFQQKMEYLADNHPDIYNGVSQGLKISLNGQKTVADRHIESYVSTAKYAGYTMDLQWDEEDRKYYITNEGALRHIQRTTGGNEYRNSFVEGKGLAYEPGHMWTNNQDAKDFWKAQQSSKKFGELTSMLGIATAPRADQENDRPPLPSSVFQGAIDRTESGGDYDALFGHSQRDGKQFEGVKVSQLTLGQLYEFSDGSYATWSRQQLGYKATPMGRYQFVGTTLKQVAREMGLPDDTKFTPAVQDAMFEYHVGKTLANQSTMSGKVNALRGQWEGFNGVSDRKLIQLIEQYETGVPAYQEYQYEQQLAEELEADRQAQIARNSNASGFAGDVAPPVEQPNTASGFAGDVPPPVEQPNTASGFTASDDPVGRSRDLEYSGRGSSEGSNLGGDDRRSGGRDFDADMATGRDPNVTPTVSMVIERQVREAFNSNNKQKIKKLKEKHPEVVKKVEAESSSPKAPTGDTAGSTAPKADQTNDAPVESADAPTRPAQGTSEEPPMVDTTAPRETIETESGQINVTTISVENWDGSTEGMTDGDFIYDRDSGDVFIYVDGIVDLAGDEDAERVREALFGSDNREQAPEVDTTPPEQPERVVSQEGRSQARGNTDQQFISPSPAMKKEVERLVTPKIKSQIENAGYEPTALHYYVNRAAAEEAFKEGRIRKGQLYITRTGNVFIIE